LEAKAMGKQADREVDPRLAFLGLRYYYPDLVLNLRAAMDVGSTPAQLKRLAKKFRRDGDRMDDLLAAIDHMAENPKAGKVVWLNSGSYNWAPEDAAEAKA
jgi:dienelactone hydrolase